MKIKKRIIWVIQLIGIPLTAALIIFTASCSNSASDVTNKNEKATETQQSTWDKMKWDEGKWK